MSGIRCWLPAALSVTVRRALRTPVVVGRNETVTLQVAPGASTAPLQPLAESRKLVGLTPVRVTLVIVRLDVPLFERVATFPAEVVLMFCRM